METTRQRPAACPRFGVQSYISGKWLRHFHINCLNRLEPEWSRPCLLPGDLREALSISLSHFQLGETGSGSCLFREAAGKCDPDDIGALELFVKEEGEHARLLARLVERLGGRLIRRHWTHRLFKLVRQAGGFHFEIQALLTGEIVGTAYYQMIHEAVQDEPLNAALNLMLSDEASHIAFHLDRQKARWREWLPLERSAWELQFQLIVLFALRAAWLDHGPCLHRLGFTWSDFRARALRTTIGFLDGVRSAGTVRQGCGATVGAAVTSS